MIKFIVLAAIVGLLVLFGGTIEWVLPVPILPALLPSKPIAQKTESQ